MKIKKLEWQHNYSGSEVMSAISISKFGLYRLELTYGEYFILLDNVPLNRKLIHCKTLEEAQQKAQEHFESIIKECVE